MTVDRSADELAPVQSTATAAPALEHRPGRWIANWDAEDKGQWEAEGRSIAKRNLYWSIFAEFLGFVVWQLWSIVVVQLPAAGFQFDTNQIFWLISIPSLVGATLRIPYTFMVPKFGGRNWTIVSALLLLIPTTGLAICVSNPETPFGIMLLMAALAGFGGGNFASSMANITFFYPAREKGWALGLNAAGGNLGAAVAQLVVPIAITLLAAGTVNLPMAGIIWIPLIIIAAFGAYKYMNNLTSAKGDVAGSLARPYGGRMADRMGGARMTIASFASMAVITLTMIWTLPLKNFWLFLTLFLLLFLASGFGNGATYRMIPVIFATSSRAARAGAPSATTARLASSSLGLISAIGAYGGFVIPQVLNASNTASGSYTPAFYGFVGAYVLMLTVCWVCYIRPARKRNTIGHI